MTIFKGNCYKFNSGKNSYGQLVESKYSLKSGMITGLRIQLYVPEPTSYYSLSSSHGVHLAVTNNSILPTYFDGFDVSVGTQTKIIISKQITKRQPSPYSDCVADAENYNSGLVKIFKKNNLKYNQKDCYNYCCKYNKFSNYMVKFF